MSLLLEALAIVAAICVCGLLLRRATGHWQWRLAASAIVVVVAGAMAATYTVTSGRALVRGWHEAHALSARAQETRAGQRLSVNVDFVEWLGRRIPRGDTYYLVQGARPHPSRRLFSWATFRLLPRFQAASPSRARWLVLYGTTPRAAGARTRGFGGWRQYAPTLLLGRRNGS